MIVKVLACISILVISNVGAKNNGSKCGVRGYSNGTIPRPKVIGGEDAWPNEFPWQVSLQRGTFHFCSGSLLNERWIVTAAHCVDGETFSSRHNVVLGAWNIQKDENSQIAVKIENAFPHPNYISSNHSNDIALIKLSSDLSEVLNDDETDKQIGTICLPEQDQKEDKWVGKKCTTSGWGRISTIDSEQQKYSGILQKVNLSMWEQSYCEESYENYRDHIDGSMICGSDYNKGSCFGDSGGPLVCHNIDDNRWTLEGVVSWGHPCAIPYHPSVYSRVSKHVSWIWQTVEANSK